LDPLLATLVQVQLVVLGQKRQHLRESLDVRVLAVSFEILSELFAFLDFAELLDGITAVLLFVRDGKNLVGDGVKVAYFLEEVLIVFGGNLHVFFMIIDLLVTLLNGLLIA
jgi:hypothetical protein